MKEKHQDKWANELNSQESVNIVIRVLNESSNYLHRCLREHCIHTNKTIGNKIELSEIMKKMYLPNLNPQKKVK